MYSRSGEGGHGHERFMNHGPNDLRADLSPQSPPKFEPFEWADSASTDKSYPASRTHLLKSRRKSINGPPVKSSGHILSWDSRTSVALRSLGLKPLLDLLRLQKSEEPKHAVDQDRVKACIRCLIHLIPVGGALVLLWLNFRQYFVGTDFLNGKAGVTSLQFAAKAHEICMVASLTAVMLSYIRYELAAKNGLPFGAAFAGLQVNSLAYLVSPSFFGSLKAASWWLKLKLFVSITVVTLLIASVGPSSAACMLPRQGSWRVPEGSGFFTLHTTQEKMFPTTLTAAMYTDPACGNPSLSMGQEGGFQSICPISDSNRVDRQGFGLLDIWSLVSMVANLTEDADAAFSVSGTWVTMGRPYTLSMMWDQVGTALVGGAPPGWVAATSLQNNVIGGLAYAFTKDLYNNQIELEIQQSMNPYSAVTCYGNNTISMDGLSNDTKLVDFGIGDAMLSVSVSGMDIRAAFEDASISSLHFVSLPNNETGLIFIDGSTSDNTSLVQLTPCTFELGWNHQPIHLASGSLFSEGIQRSNSKQPLVANADISWLNTINPHLDTGNLTQFSTQGIPYSTENMTLFEIIQLYVGYHGLYNLTTLQSATIASTTSTLLTVALFLTSPWPVDGSVVSASIPKHPTSFGLNGADAFYYYMGYNASDPSNISSSDGLRFVMQYDYFGLGYGPNETAVKASLAILIAYCLIALAHTIYSIATGTSSSAWSSITEVVALTTNSRPAEELKNTSAGIQTSNMFGKNVRIVPTGGPSNIGSASREMSEFAERHLELLFTSSNPDAGSGRVKANKAYGDRL